MREFRCSSLGYQCSWKHIATEELLADMVALHLRDVHGVQALDNEMVGKIKNLFTYPTKADAAGAADLVMKEYNCDMGAGMHLAVCGHERGPDLRGSGDSMPGKSTGSGILRGKWGPR